MNDTETTWKIFNQTNKKLPKYFGGLKKVRIFANNKEEVEVRFEKYKNLRFLQIVSYFGNFHLATASLPNRHHTNEVAFG